MITRHRLVKLEDFEGKKVAEVYIPWTQTQPNVLLYGERFFQCDIFAEGDLLYFEVSGMKVAEQPKKPLKGKNRVDQYIKWLEEKEKKDGRTGKK